MVRDVTVAAHNLTNDALHRIMTHLVDILASLSPAITRRWWMMSRRKPMKNTKAKRGMKEKSQSFKII
ncbi:hypothetical protein V6N13_130145 [Hibiscus sabdariffa]|uniref:Uncharacterized protein n=1 Tax=Hibiscus sabdariffa TaxID=183260 RepID=A0ABR2SNI5_9ROSI